MVKVFREVRRVLRDDGTLWLNLGDSYSNAGTRQGDRDGGVIVDQRNDHRMVGNGYRPRVDGLKNKDLVGIPWRVAFALQADGWYLRSDIIWHKPNPMPESVTDRPTKAHEYLFLLTKSERYYYDSDAVREEAIVPAGRVMKFGATSPSGTMRHDIGASYIDNGKRNRRSVWTVATQPYSGAHFATFPPALIEPCVMAGSKKGDTVLDPFGGAGTTGLVADRLGRDAILVELNPEYAAMARTRIHSDNPLFTEVA
jgi:DNA modification methylase